MSYFVIELRSRNEISFRKDLLDSSHSPVHPGGDLLHFDALQPELMHLALDLFLPVGAIWSEPPMPATVLADLLIQVLGEEFSCVFRRSSHVLPRVLYIPDLAWI